MSGTKRRRGFTIIEMITVIVIFALLVFGVFRILSSTVRNFTKQEESVFCTGEGALLIAQVKQDFERLIARGTFSSRYDQALSAVTSDIHSGVTLFKILGKTGPEEITFSFNKIARNVARLYGGRELVFGNGRVAEFRLSWHLLGTDGLVRNFPPGTATPEPPAPLDGQVLRAWGTFVIVIESPPSGSTSQKPVHQEYQFNVFPVRLNSELRSIWKSD